MQIKDNIIQGFSQTKININIDQMLTIKKT